MVSALGAAVISFFWGDMLTLTESKPRFDYYIIEQLTYKIARLVQFEAARKIK